jgi:hypothetical protein
MKRKPRSFEVFSLSAIDLFASAMGAFIIITIILMPDYQKEVRSEGHLEFLESLAGKTQAILDETEQGQQDILKAMQAAKTRQEQLEAEQEIVSAELETINAELQARNDQPPPPPPSPVETEEEISSNLVTFRFLGLKTDKTRFLLMVDMNRYLAEHSKLVTITVARALESLQPGYEFSILGFQHTDSGPVYHRWPENGELVPMSARNRARANSFLRQLSGKFQGASSLVRAFETGLKTDAEAIILISDGLPNPAYNDNLSPGRLVRAITLMNTSSKEIHAVTIGDYFKYRGTVEFMEALARANAGGFLALAQ